MTIDYPKSENIPGLRRLWQEAFGDSDAFLDSFFATGFSPGRCRCIVEEGQIVAAHYWFDCSCNGRKIAYLYAVATAKSHRGQGLCKGLMAETHKLLASLGYCGGILVPGEKSLFDFYGNQGYETIACAERFSCKAGTTSVAVEALSPGDYAARRRQLLPENGVLQEGENLDFLSAISGLYGGNGWVMAAALDGSALTAMEFLGDRQVAPGILTALGMAEGAFRAPGNAPFAMYLGFDGGEIPSYFGLAFD